VFQLIRLVLIEICSRAELNLKVLVPRLQIFLHYMRALELRVRVNKGTVRSDALSLA